MLPVKRGFQHLGQSSLPYPNAASISYTTIVGTQSAFEPSEAPVFFKTGLSSGGKIFVRRLPRNGESVGSAEYRFQGHS